MHHAQLREQRETIEGLVDDVVECYHNGFAKAIHNYSQILQLFSDSKAQVLLSHMLESRRELAPCIPPVLGITTPQFCSVVGILFMMPLHNRCVRRASHDAAAGSLPDGN